MTVAPTVIDAALACVALVPVAFTVGRPAEDRPDDVGKRGGRWRWWLARATGKHARYADYLPIAGRPEERWADHDVTFVAELCPGRRYCLGVGNATRIDLEVPHDVAGPVRCIVNPESSSVVWTTDPMIDTDTLWEQGA